MGHVLGRAPTSHHCPILKTLLDSRCLPAYHSLDISVMMSRGQEH